MFDKKLKMHSPIESDGIVCFCFSLMLSVLCPISFFPALSSLFFVKLLERRDGDFKSELETKFLGTFRFDLSIYYKGGVDYTWKADKAQYTSVIG